MKYLTGDRKFYKRVLLIAVPIMIQNGITNFVGFLDNIMVGQIGTDQMSGVAIVNQLIFVFNLCIFGAISGAGIFGAQFFGQKNHQGVRETFRFKLVISGLLTVLWILIFLFFGKSLIGMYLHEGSESGNMQATLQYAQEYLVIMLIGLVPFAVEQCYSGTLRETGETVIPMKAGITAVIVNLIFNYLLIFGKFGAPRLGAAGAAYATVLSRFVECTVIVSWTHRHRAKNQFIQGVYRHFQISSSLAWKIITKGTPLLLNEFLWSSGMAVLNQCYSTRGLAVVAATNISSTISNLFNIVFIALGTAVGIIVGQHLGAGRFEEAKESAARIIFMSVVSTVVIGIIMILTAPLFPSIYNTTEEVQKLAADLIRITGCVIPMQAYLHAAYFTIRSGGKTLITFLFDSVYVWICAIPVAFLLSHYTGLSIVPLFLAVQLLDIIKVLVGSVMLKKGIWLNNIVES